MATLEEIKCDPVSYLSEGGTEDDYQMFIDAVETLMAEGLDEQTAIETVWNDGDWYGLASSILDR